MECLETKAQTHTKSEVLHKIIAVATTQENGMQNLEKIGDKLCRKINNISTVSQQPQWKDVTCSDCNIDGDVTEKCFKSKTCFNYIEVGYIANFVQ